MRTTRTVLVFLAAAALLGPPGCANSSIYGEVTGGAVRVETYVDGRVNGLTMALGERFDVSCKLLDAADREVGGAATFDVTPATFALDGLAVIPQKAGDYKVACRQVGGDLVDPTPAVVTVRGPQGSARIRTILPAATVPACWEGTVTCEVLDAEGAVVADPETVVFATPTGGLRVDGHRVSADAPGAWKVACALADGSLVDPAPPTLTVAAALPERIVTRLEPAQVAPGETAQVHCDVFDTCGAAVTDLPTRVVADAGATVLDHTVSAAEPGSYTVLCHPQGELKPPTQDEPAELVVVEPPPQVVRIELEATPDRNVYALNSTVEVVGVAYAADGRVVPGAEITITAPPAMAPQTAADTWKFTAEGAFTFRGVLATDPHVTAELTLVCDAGPPTLVIFSPERGSTFDGEGFIPVRGTVTDVGGVAELRVNGVAIPVAADGSFAYDWPAAYGLNHLWFRAKDSYGRTVRTSRACYFSTGWLPMDPPAVEGARLLDSALLYLGQEGLDDGDHDPAHIDDIATILEVVLGSLIDIESLLGAGGGPIPLFQQAFPGIVSYRFSLLGVSFEIRGDLYLTVQIDRILVGDWRVSALYRDGGIDFLLGLAGPDEADGSEGAGLGAILGVTLAFDLEAGFYRPLNGDWVGVGLDPPASVRTQTSAYLRGLFLEVGVDADMPPGGELDVAVSNLRITIEDIDINPLEDLTIDFGGVDLPLVGHIDLPEVPLTGLVSGLNNLIGDALLDPVLNWAVTGLSDLLAPLVSQAATYLVQMLVDVLALDLDLPLPQLPGAPAPVTLHLSARPSSVSMDPQGGQFGLAAGLWADKGVERDPLGTILRDGCHGADEATLAFDPATPMQAAFLLDFVNEAIFALWWGGGINLQLDLGSLGGLGGVANGVVGLDFLLPPILTDCTDGGHTELQLGDLYLALNGGAMGFSGGLKAWVSARLGAEIVANGNTLGLRVVGRPALELEIVEVTGALAAFETLIPGLIEDQLIPLLVDGIDNALGAIPIPEIDLGGLLPGIPPGTVIRLGDLRAGAEHGYVLVGGALQ
jgi:hypothetical protein